MRREGSRSGCDGGWKVEASDATRKRLVAVHCQQRSGFCLGMCDEGKVCHRERQSSDMMVHESVHGVEVKGPQFSIQNGQDRRRIQRTLHGGITHES